jgi:DNA (cytosine-5)-methyltransferase 1
MKYLSVCSGIEAASVAWHPLGWTPVAFSEVDPFPCAVLAHHYPSVPNWGDMARFQEWPDATIDVLVGGTPCQSFSIAGLRKGLADPRGNLALTYLAILDRYRPRWCCWENVPGVLSADGGRALGAFLGGLGELGYGFAYRVLDAQHFGLAQRRKRVFVVGHLGDWRRAAAVLFERASLSGHPAPRREAGEVAPTVPARRSGGGGLGTDFDCDGGLIAGTLGSHTGIEAQQAWTGRLIPEGARALTSSDQRIDAETETLLVSHALRADGFDASEDGTGRGTPLVAEIAPTLRAGGNATGGHRPPGTDVDTCDSLVPVAHVRQSDVVQYGDQAGSLDTQGHRIAVAFSAKDHGADAGDIAPTLRAGGHARSHANGGVMPAVAQHMAVRRLTPRECERLQGFPDDYTLVPYRGKPAADGPRYKAIGNSMAVPCMSWIGRRIQMVDDLG